MTIPSLNGLGQPIFEDLHIIDMMSLQGSSDNDPLHRFSHIEPGASTGRVQKPNAAFMAPTHQIATGMSCQIIQDEQHAQRRIHLVQLLCCGKRVPLLPAPPVGDQFWSGWTSLENGSQFAHEPGMQDGIGALIDRFSPQFTSSWPKQRQEFARLATNILVILGRRPALQLKSVARVRNGLIWPCLILAPQGQAQSFSQDIGSLNYRFFSWVYGSSLW
jgi:hypothetical protein